MLPRTGRKREHLRSAREARRGLRRLHPRLPHDPDARLDGFVHRSLDQGMFWPEPHLSLNPSFASGGLVDDLVAGGVRHAGCATAFRRDKNEVPGGLPLRLHRHQVEAIHAAASPGAPVPGGERLEPRRHLERVILSHGGGDRPAARSARSPGCTSPPATYALPSAMTPTSPPTTSKPPHPAPRSSPTTRTKAWSPSADGCHATCPPSPC